MEPVLLADIYFYQAIGLLPFLLVTGLGTGLAPLGVVLVAGAIGSGGF